MNLSSFPFHSLRTRIVLLTVAIFVVSIWGLSFFTSQVLRKDMERLLGEQQFSTVSLLATQVNREILDRLTALEGLANSIHPGIMTNATSVQTYLDQRPYFRDLFNDGVMVFGADSVAIATFPLSPERMGVNYIDRDYLVGALQEGKSTIGKPVIGKTLNAPFFAIAVPIRDFQGKVIGAVSGVTNLGKPNFLDKITENRYGKTGGYLLISSQHRLIVTATEKIRIMNPLQALGMNPTMDRFTQGYEGSAVYVNTRGVEVLSSAAGVPAAGWFVLATLPTVDAFSPIRDMQQSMLLATLLLTLASGGLTWWLLRRQLSPLFDATKALSNMSASSQPLRALPVARQDEIGQLIGTFNQLLSLLGERETALQETQATLQAAMDQSPSGISIVDAATGSIRYLNDAALHIRGEDRETYLKGKGLSLVQYHGNRPLRDLDGRPLDPDEIPINRAAKFGDTCGREFMISRPDGTNRIVESKAAPIRNAKGEITAGMAVFQDITERKRAEEKINQLAFFDQLTELPNRTLLQDRLKQAMASSLRSGRYGAVLLLDLDHFKTLNDTLGHDMGDLLLKQVAQRLTDCVREEDTVARQGGDEFVLMLVSLSESQVEAASLVELVGGKIIAALNQPFVLKDVTYHISPSIGATVFLGQQTDIDTLLKQADLAMYKAKDAGRNTLRFFDPDMAREVLKRASLDNDLRDALQKKQFALHYQAQMSGDQVTGAEVLLRWQHPGRGLVFPGDFISVIEETGLILPVGQWVLESACQQLADWATQPEMSHLTVAVNISARQLNHGDFVNQVLRALELSGANPERLKLELTESLLVNNVEKIIGKMNVLKAKGVGFSLDDFGTGYSSLSYLKRLPLDQLKIDQSFVRDILADPNDAAIARMIVVLAENLGLTVIAEGVEIEAQRDSLTQLGCHAYQGYLFSRPVPLDEFESYVRRV